MKNTFTIFRSSFILGLLLLGCQPDPKGESEQALIPENIQDTLHIATGSEMSYIIQNLAQIFTLDYPSPYKVHTVNRVDLVTQIQKDTLFDFIFSIDQDLLDTLYQAGLTLDAPVDLAYGKLVLWTTQSGFMPDLVALRSPAIKQVVLPNPETNAYGLRALSILKKEQMIDFLEARLVYQEDLRTTNQLITSGKVSIGFTSKSMVLTPEYTEVGSWIEVDDRLYDPVPHQFIRLHKPTVNHPLADPFEQFIQSQRVKDLLTNFGYLPNGLLEND